MARRGRHFGLHTVTVVLLVVGFLATTILVAALLRSIRDGNDRFLSSQSNQVAGALRASIPPIQQPLEAGVRIARISGVPQFQSYESSEVGFFRSVSLWSMRGGLHLVAYVGEPPLIQAGNPAALHDLARVAPNGELDVVGIISGAVRALGFAERLPGQYRDLVVYAEDSLPTTQLEFPANSPYFGLSFALFEGRTTSPSRLIERDIALPVQHATRQSTVMYGNQPVTILVELTQRPPGVLTTGAMLLVAFGAAALTCLVGATTELLVRRRDSAERAAAHTRLRYDELRGISATLQHSLLPLDLPSVPGLDLAGTYLAGVRALGVGGDWYDAVVLQDGRVFLSVGDVAGKGDRAAQAMTSVRHAIRAYAVQGDDPADVIVKLNELVDIDRDDCFATVLCARTGVAERTVELVSAGHLPPLLVDERGARYVSVQVGMPVGVAQGPIDPPTPTWLALSPGASLAFFTDGLVERRGASLDEGLAQVQGAASVTAASTAATLVSRLSRALPEESHDDVAILVARWVTGATPVEGVPRHAAAGSRRRFAGERESIEPAREFALSHVHGSAEQREVVALLVSELATNAVVHAHTPFEVHVTPVPERGVIRIAVCDEGQGEVRVRTTPPDGDGGFGLSLVATLSTDWGVEHDALGKRVWFETSSDASVT